MSAHSPYLLHYLDQLENESIYIFREAAQQIDALSLLFSGGKDSMVMIHLAQKAFWPGPIPFPVIHIDTGHNFPETMEFRDSVVKQRNLRLIVGNVKDSIKRKTAVDEEGLYASRNALQSITLLETIEEYNLGGCFGGGRRDEERSRAKERIFSYRNSFGAWEPKNQRPELWHLFNGKKKKGEHFRIFPLSNWTELDIWNYIKREKIDLPSLYYSHRREIFLRDNHYYAAHPLMKNSPHEKVEADFVRFRTVGDMTCTAAIKSRAKNIPEIITELLTSNTSERGSRMDDKRSENAMEERKLQGYF